MFGRPVTGSKEDQVRSLKEEAPALSASKASQQRWQTVRP